VDDELNALLDIGQIARERSLTEFHARASLVDKIDGLVGEEAIRNVPVRSVNSRFDRLIRITDRVEFLVAVFDAVHDLHGVGFVGRRNFDSLEAAFERPILLDRLAELRRRGGADALNFTARESGFQNIGRVERAFSRTGADQGMKLIDEDDGVLIFHQLFHDGLQALFELPAVFGARDDQRKIERQNALVSQERRHVALGNLLRETFDDGGLADAGLADQHGVILRAAAENLDNALQLVIAADQRIERIVHRGLGKVARELGEKRTLFGAVRCYFFGLRTLKFLPDGGKTEPALVQDFSREALLFAEQTQQKMLGPYMFVIEAFGLFSTVRKNTFALVAQGKVDRRRNFLPNRRVPFNLLSNGIDGRVGPKKPVCQLFVLTQESKQEMLGLDVRTAELTRLVPGEEYDAPRFFRITFEHLL
jgi:hypothetical protein